MTQDQDTAQATAASAGDACVREYEGLRDHMLNGTAVDRPYGPVVLLRHGLAAWSARRRVDTPAARAPRPPASASPRIVDGDPHAALVPILLDMVLGRRQEVHL